MSPSRKKTPAAPSSADLIRASGVRVTRGRVRVLDVLLSAPRPATHGEVEAAVAHDGGAAMDRVTLYRVLESLVGCGLALKSFDNRGVYRYTADAARERHGGHVHFRCDGCGDVFCLDAPPPAPPRLPRGFRLAAVELDVHGTCVKCSQGGKR